MDVKDTLSVIRKHWTTAPVPIFKILEELKLGPEYRALPQNISGAIERSSNVGFKVVINQSQSRTRQRFTAAHELGHYVYHRDLLGQGTGDTLAYRAEGTAFPNPNIRVANERQANTFAANVLMPSHLIDALKDAGVTSPAAMADALGVSEEAMKIRLGIAR